MAGVEHLVSLVEGTAPRGRRVGPRRWRPCSRAARSPVRPRSPHSTTSTRSSRSVVAPRWVPSGTVWPNGDFELALTIRTFAIGDGRIHLWVGGGVVWDSDPAGRGRGIVGQGASVAGCHRGRLTGDRGGMNPILATVRGGRPGPWRGRPRPRRSSTPMTPACCAAWRPSRPCASTADDPSPWLSTSSGCDSPRHGCTCECPDASGAASDSQHEAARRRRRGRLLATLHGHRGPSGRWAGGHRWSWCCPCPATSTHLRERGIGVISLQLGIDPRLRRDAPWLLDGVKSTSYAVNMAAYDEARASRCRRRHLRRRRRLGAGGTRHQRVVATRRGALHAGARPGHPGRRHPGVRHPSRRRRPATRYRGGLVPADRTWPQADEAFTSSSVRELMPIVRSTSRASGTGRPGTAAALALQARCGAPPERRRSDA